MKVIAAIPARTEAASQSPSGTAVAPPGSSLQKASTSGGGEKTACRRPGEASPTTVSATAADTGRTTRTGCAGVGLKTPRAWIAERNVPAARVLSTARPPISVTSPSTPSPSTRTSSSIVSGVQVSRTTLLSHWVLRCGKSKTAWPSRSTRTGGSVSYVSSRPPLVPTEASRLSVIQPTSSALGSVRETVRW
ncbi:hypothetical protein ACU635_20455 [[Actinomadura] parvosata]|uniref:hypothetical protein n=1 Tax=[Actinomadura] parvosata TaxID=1955412 RepID=UPI00406CFC89